MYLGETISVIPEKNGAECPGNGRGVYPDGTPIGCFCDECEYLQCCLEEDNCDDCYDCTETGCPHVGTKSAGL